MCVFGERPAIGIEFALFLPAVTYQKLRERERGSRCTVKFIAHIKFIISLRIVKNANTRNIRRASKQVRGKIKKQR